MKIFTNLLDFENYIPNCIICQKHMNIMVSSTCNINKKISYFKFKLEGEKFSSQHNLISVCNSTGEVTGEPQSINCLLGTRSSIRKYCRTCDFYCYGNCKPTQKNIFPLIKLTHESLNYTMPKGKPIKIMNYLYNEFPNSTLNVNHKILYLPKDIINFDNITNIKQLNSKIKTILTFA